MGNSTSSSSSSAGKQRKSSKSGKSSAAAAPRGEPAAAAAASAPAPQRPTTTAAPRAPPGPIDLGKKSSTPPAANTSPNGSPKEPKTPNTPKTPKTPVPIPPADTDIEAVAEAARLAFSPQHTHAGNSFYSPRSGGSLEPPSPAALSDKSTDSHPDMEDDGPLSPKQARGMHTLMKLSPDLEHVFHFNMLETPEQVNAVIALRGRLSQNVLGETLLEDDYDADAVQIGVWRELDKGGDVDGGPIAIARCHRSYAKSPLADNFNFKMPTAVKDPAKIVFIDQVWVDFDTLQNMASQATSPKDVAALLEQLSMATEFFTMGMFHAFSRCPQIREFKPDWVFCNASPNAAVGSKLKQTGVVEVADCTVTESANTYYKVFGKLLFGSSRSEGFTPSRRRPSVSLFKTRRPSQIAQPMKPHSSVRRNSKGLPSGDSQPVETDVENPTLIKFGEVITDIHHVKLMKSAAGLAQVRKLRGLMTAEVMGKAASEAGDFIDRWDDQALHLGVMLEERRGYIKKEPVACLRVHLDINDSPAFENFNFKMPPDVRPGAKCIFIDHFWYNFNVTLDATMKNAEKTGDQGSMVDRLQKTVSNYLQGTLQAVGVMPEVQETKPEWVFFVSSVAPVPGQTADSPPPPPPPAAEGQRPASVAKKREKINPVPGSEPAEGALSYYRFFSQLMYGRADVIQYTPSRRRPSVVLPRQRRPSGMGVGAIATDKKSLGRFKPDELGTVLSPRLLPGHQTEDEFIKANES